MKDRSSQTFICSGESKDWGGMRIVATFCHAASQATVGSSTGMATGSPWTWTEKSKRASPAARWAAIANRRRSGESIAGADGVRARSGAAMYFTADGPSFEGVVLQ